MRNKSPILPFVVAAISALGAGKAHAQASPSDIVRSSIRPVVVLLLDTSGSMEYMTTAGLNSSGAEDLANQCSDVMKTQASGGCYPGCATNTTTDQQNRWAIAQQALTGTFNNFSCTLQGNAAGRYDTTYFSTTAPDYGYYIPYHKPNYTDQVSDGVLDMFMQRVKFGLMTFDSVGTLRTNTAGLLAQSAWTPAFLADNVNGPNGALGMFSYGGSTVGNAWNAGNKTFTFPGCTTTYVTNNGAQSALDLSASGAGKGTLVVVGVDGVVDPNFNNGTNIQPAILAARPFGGTPVAGMLDDFRYYLKTSSDVVATSAGGADRYGACRPRYGLLLTDGVPDSDMRGAPIHCDTAGSQCPYDLPENIVADMCQINSGTGKCDPTAPLSGGLFVVGFAVGDAQSQTRLNLLASKGGTSTAYYANDLASLKSALSAALDQASKAVITRTAPAFATGVDASTGTLALPEQFQVNSGFTVGNSTGGTFSPWKGILKMSAYTCQGASASTTGPSLRAPQPSDDFAVTLKAQASRHLWTAFPSVADATHEVGNLVSTFSSSDGSFQSAYTLGGTGMPPAYSSTAADVAALTRPYATVGDPNPTGSAFTSGSATQTVLNTASVADATNTYSWVAATSGDRALSPLGPIYHSTPAVVGAPSQDAADEAFNYFREQTSAGTRPATVYVETNDGILHAFAADANAGAGLTEGQELWGFIPPKILPDLQTTISGPVTVLDATPLVQDVFLRRIPGNYSGTATSNTYRTVLLSAFGGNGGGDGHAGYFALDVTDPQSPHFLWQFSLPDFGPTYGQPAIAQVFMKSTSSGTVYEERAVAILPAGAGTASSATKGTRGCSANSCPLAALPPSGTAVGFSPTRACGSCWAAYDGTTQTGRSVALVDVATGKLISYLSASPDSTPATSAPLTGSVSVYPGGIGVVSSRAFTTDREGITYRIDFSNPDPNQWFIEPFYDTFGIPGADLTGELAEMVGQPGYFPPVLSADKQGNMVLMQATGDINNIDSTANNRVVSITEKLQSNVAACSLSKRGSSCWTAGLNWEIPLAVTTGSSGHQVTGPMQLFNSTLYFGSYAAKSTHGDPCQSGESYIWGVDYRDGSATFNGTDTVYSNSDGTPAPHGKLDSGTATGTITGPPYVNYVSEGQQLVMGVGITQRPTCFAGATGATPSTYHFASSAGGDYNLVAQLSGRTGVSVSGTTSVATVTQKLMPPALVAQATGYTGSVQ